MNVGLAKAGQLHQTATPKVSGWKNLRRAMSDVRVIQLRPACTEIVTQPAGGGGHLGCRGAGTSQPGGTGVTL